MKKYSLILLFSFFFLMNNVNAEYYLNPNEFTMSLNNTTTHLDYYGVNNGDVTDVYTLNGNSTANYRYEFALDGSQCGSNTDTNQCFNTIQDIENGAVSPTQYGYFSMCVSKPQIRFRVSWSTCNNSCLKKSNDLIVINPSYQSCTLGLYNTETGQNMTNDGYLVRVYYDITKWQFIEGAYTAINNGYIYLDNLSDSTLYYRFINDIVLSDRNMASWDSGYGVFNHDYSQPDIGGESFLNDGTCVQSYNKMNNYSYNNNWNLSSDTLTLNSNLPYERITGSHNLFDISKVLDTSGTNGYIKNNHNYSLDISTIQGSVGIAAGFPYSLKTYCPDCQVGQSYTLTFNTDGYKFIYLLGANITWNINTSLTITQQMLDSMVIFYAKGIGTTATIKNIQITHGSYLYDYQPFGGYYVSYNNLQSEIAVFHYYDTNLYEPGNVFIYYDNYDNDNDLLDMVNCRNAYVCKYEDMFSFNHLTNILSPSKDWVNHIKLYWVGSEPIYFVKPYIFDLYEVPGRATWKEYYMPAGSYICSDNNNGTYYNATTKEVYYNPDKPPKIVSNNPNGQSQNIFGIEVNFYGLSGLFNIPVQIVNNIKDGVYNNCQPLDIPFPGFPDKHLYLPCMTSYVYERYPTLLSIYRVIIYGFISIRIGIGTLIYIKKWYDGTIESGD